MADANPTGPRAGNMSAPDTRPPDATAPVPHVLNPDDTPAEAARRRKAQDVALAAKNPHRGGVNLGTPAGILPDVGGVPAPHKVDATDDDDDDDTEEAEQEEAGEGDAWDAAVSGAPVDTPALDDDPHDPGPLPDAYSADSPDGDVFEGWGPLVSTPAARDANAALVSEFASAITLPDGFALANVEAYSHLGGKQCVQFTVTRPGGRAIGGEVTLDPDATEADRLDAWRRTSHGIASAPVVSVEQFDAGAGVAGIHVAFVGLPDAAEFSRTVQGIPTPAEAYANLPRPSWWDATVGTEAVPLFWLPFLSPLAEDGSAVEFARAFGFDAYVYGPDAAVVDSLADDVPDPTLHDGTVTWAMMPAELPDGYTLAASWDSEDGEPAGLYVQPRNGWSAAVLAMSLLHVHAAAGPVHYDPTAEAMQAPPPAATPASDALDAMDTDAARDAASPDTV